MIIGHDKQWSFLKKSAELGKLPHALLFSGLGKIGKKKTAIKLVQFLNCSSSSSPCQECRSCLAVEKKKHPDLAFVSPEERGIQISQIRNLINHLSLSPHSSEFKVGIIDKAHTMTPEAQNCFLKLLEEPKGKTLLILVTEYPDTILPTIISRVQVIRFSPVKKELIERHLSRKGVKNSEELASLSLGRPGLALDFAENPEKIEDRNKIISDLLNLKKAPLSERFSYAKKLADSSFETKQVLSVWTEFLRRAMIGREEASFKDSPSFLKRVQNTMFLISTTNINPKLAIENLLINL